MGPWARRRRAATSSSDGHSTSASPAVGETELHSTRVPVPSWRTRRTAHAVPLAFGAPRRHRSSTTQLWPGSLPTPTATGAPSAAACTAHTHASSRCERGQAGASRLDERRTVRLGSDERRRALREERELSNIFGVFRIFRRSPRSDVSLRSSANAGLELLGTRLRSNATSNC